MNVFSANNPPAPEPVDRIDGLRVLHVAATAYGANWMFEILKGLRARGYDVAALISGRHGDLAANLEREGIPYYVGDLDVFSTLDVIKVIQKIVRLTRFFRHQRFDIVHYHLFPSVILGRIAAWLADVPLRFSMITGPFYLEAPASREIDLRTVWMDSKVIASCAYTRQLYCNLGVDPSKIELIYYGAESALFDPAKADPYKLRCELGIPLDEPIVGIVAYFYAPLSPSPWTPHYLHNRAIKGHEILIEAIPLILERNPHVKFLFVGKGWGEVGSQYEKELRDRVIEMGLDHSVIFTGFRPNIPDVLAGLDVSVQCSLNENLGGTIESLLMARPTVASAVGGMVDSVRHEQTGLLVPPDDPRRLATAILTLLGDPIKAKRLGDNGRRLMLEQFSLAKTLEDIDRMYQSSVLTIARAHERVRNPSSVYYRVHLSLGRLLFFPLYLTWYYFVREIPRSIDSAFRTSWRKWTSRQISGVIADLVPLGLPFLILLYILPIPWNAILLGGSILAFVMLRMTLVGPTIQLIRLLTKRSFDVIVAASALFILSPLWLLAIVLIRLNSPGPILVRETRIGRSGMDFESLRFRTTASLQTSHDINSQSAHAVRITRIGRFLLALGIDGIPQLFNVLRSDMSIVGPHPEIPEREKQFTLAQRRRSDVKPGLFGWAGLHDQSLSDSDMVNLDIWYATHWSFWLDVYICLRTPFHRIARRVRMQHK